MRCTTSRRVAGFEVDDRSRRPRDRRRSVAQSEMNVTLEYGTEDLTIWLPVPDKCDGSSEIEGLPQCRLLFRGGDVLQGFQFCSDVRSLCPYELAKLAAANQGSQVNAALETTFDPSCDMGYVHFDKRGPASVQRSIDCGTVIVDVGNDGAIIGIEVFSPTRTLPSLVETHRKMS